MALELHSPAFQNGGTIPARFTCEGEDISPALIWSNPPAGTRSFALIVDDPDAPAGLWVHWVVYNIPADVLSLPEGLPSGRAVVGGHPLAQGMNSDPKNGYGGPCPPRGRHRYFFKLYALGESTKLPPGLTAKDLLAQIRPLILSEAVLMGTYEQHR